MRIFFCTPVKKKKKKKKTTHPTFSKSRFCPVIHNITKFEFKSNAPFKPYRVHSHIRTYMDKKLFKMKIEVECINAYFKIYI